MQALLGIYKDAKQKQFSTNDSIDDVFEFQQNMADKHFSGTVSDDVKSDKFQNFNGEVGAIAAFGMYHIAGIEAVMADHGYVNGTQITIDRISAF